MNEEPQSGYSRGENHECSFKSKLNVGFGRKLFFDASLAYLCFTALGDIDLFESLAEILSKLWVRWCQSLVDAQRANLPQNRLRKRDALITICKPLGIEARLDSQGHLGPLSS